MLNVRFSSALKAVLLLGHAEEAGSPVLSSTQLARSLNTNPSLVLKLMVTLVQDGLVAPIKGRSGGVRLGRPADQITLGQIYHSAIGDKPLCPPARRAPSHLPSLWSHRSDMIIDLARFHVPSKMLKRQMFGRANFALLRKRVLLVT